MGSDSRWSMTIALIHDSDVGEEALENKVVFHGLVVAKGIQEPGDPRADILAVGYLLGPVILHLPLQGARLLEQAGMFSAQSLNAMQQSRPGRIDFGQETIRGIG